MLGVLSFGLLFVSTHIRSLGTRARVVIPLSYVIAAGAAVFIFLQVYIGHFCSLCMTVDVTALLIGLCGFMLRGAGFESAAREEGFHSVGRGSLLSEGQRIKGVWREDSQVYSAPNPVARPSVGAVFVLPVRSWILLLLVSLGAPLLFPLFVRTSEVPGVIRGMYERDHITVLEFFDFQCPHCQQLSPRLAQLVAQESGFQLKYGYTPLPANPSARVAATMAICAAEQGKEKEVVLRFFEVLEFSEAALTKMAREIVPDDAKFAACLASERPTQRIASDTHNLKSAGFEGLPTTYVGGIRILGSQEDSQYRDAFARVRAGSDTSGLNPWVYFAGVLLLVVAIVLMGRESSHSRASS